MVLWPTWWQPRRSHRVSAHGEWGCTGAGDGPDGPDRRNGARQSRVDLVRVAATEAALLGPGPSRTTAVAPELRLPRPRLYMVSRGGLARGSPLCVRVGPARPPRQRVGNRQPVSFAGARARPGS